MSKLRWLTVLMGITILGITGFQLYWLRQNYSREEKTLGIKADVTFRETVVRLQASKLRLGTWADSGQGRKLKVAMADGERIDLDFKPREEVVSTINIIRDRYMDSIPEEMKKAMIISVNKSSIGFGKDTAKFRHRVPGPGQDYVLDLLYGVDSLQDSIKLEEVNTLYKKALQEQQLDIPFTVTKTVHVEGWHEPETNQVTIGFMKPVTYQLQLGNTFPYLMKRIAAPILFSILLTGITILSFILLYRNLLKQQRLAALKNEFISNITHELKTPIATVGVAIEALKNFNAMQDMRRTKEYLDISANELQRLSLLVDKVLKLSMFEKKEIELKYEPMNIKGVIDEVVGSLRLQFEKHQAEVSIHAEGDLDMQGDRLHLLSVIFNLLDNAVKYSKEKPVIQIDLKGDDTSVIIKIMDDGIGIPSEYKEKVFEKFFRVPHGNTHNAKGYGLGLSYAAQVVRKHQGRIDLQSETGSGTLFTITLPKGLS